jgi:hypothetical protein
MFTFATDYTIFVFFATVGVVQVAASLGSLNGLLFIRNPRAAQVAGAVLILGSFIWFFSTGSRNVNDFEGGLDANTQALFFFLGGFAAVGFTLLASSLINRRMNGLEPEPHAGLDSLRHTTYLRAVTHSLALLWRQCRTLMNRSSSG